MTLVWLQLLLLLCYRASGRGRIDLIEHAQVLLIDGIAHLIRPPIAVAGLCNHGNAGDSALALATFSFLRRVGFESHMFVANLSQLGAGQEEFMKRVRNIVRPANGTIVFAPGGNLGTLYPFIQKVTTRIISEFTDVRIVHLPQSFTMHTPLFAQTALSAYQRHPDLHVFLRERTSFALANSVMLARNLYLTPDMAFMLGDQAERSRQLFPRPSVSILWVDRKDTEKLATKLCSRNLTDGQLLNVDWGTGPNHHLLTAPHHDAFWQSETDRALQTLSQGRVVMTSRLHGQILAILLGIPTVVLDDQTMKGRNYFDTWSHAFPFVVAPLSCEAESVALRIFLDMTKE